MRNTSKRKIPETIKYRDIISYYGKIEYYKKFIEHLKKGLIGYTSEDTSNKIMELLKNKVISIVSPEAFLDETYYITDISIDTFNHEVSIKSYLNKLLFNIKKELNKGMSSIVLTNFLLILSFCLPNKDDEASNKGESLTLIPLLEFFLMSLATEGENPLTIRIPDSSIYKILFKKYMDKGLKTYSLNNILICIVNALKNFKENAPQDFNPPNIEILRGMYSDIKHNQHVYLQETFNLLPRAQINNAIKNVKDLNTPNAELEAALELLSSQMGEYPYRDASPIMLELQRIAKQGQKKTFKYNADLQDMFKNANLKMNEAHDLGIKEVFIDYEIFKNTPSLIFSEVKINCKGKSLEEIKVFIGYAAILNLLKKCPKAHIQKNYKITLYNVETVQEDMLAFVQDRKRVLENIYNREFFFEVQYLPESARSLAGMDKPKYIRVISDIHCDINNNENYSFNFGNDIVLNCGDTSGDCITTSNWIRSYIRRGIFIHGNHLGYSYPFSYLNSSDNEEIWHSYIHKDNTYVGQTLALNSEFKASENIRYLSDSYKIIDGIVFIGCCLHTDFCLFGENKQKESMECASSRMNDFRYRYVYTECKREQIEPHLLKTTLCDKHIRRMQPIDYLDRFIKSVLFIEKTIRKFPNSPIVLITHFAPLPFSVEKQYKNDPLSAVFASDLRWLFKKYHNIRLAVHGHTHSKFDYIYEKTRVICDPFGYKNENNNKLPYKYGTRVLLENIISSNSWQALLTKEVLKGKIKVVSDKDWYLPVQKFVPTKNVFQKH